MRARARLTRSDGAAAVEFAILLPFLVLIVFGMIDFGRAFTTRSNLQEAVQEGSIYGVYNPTDVAGIRSRVVESTTSPAIDSGDVVVSCPTADTLAVSLTYDLNLITPIIGSIVGDPLTMRIESSGDVLSTTPCASS